MVKVSCTHLNQIEGGALPVITDFSSKHDKKQLPNSGPTGEPMQYHQFADNILR